MAADALSRQHECLALMGLSQPIFDSISEIQAKYATDPEASIILQQFHSNQPTRPHFFLRVTFSTTETVFLWWLILYGVLAFYRNFTHLPQQDTLAFSEPINGLIEILIGQV